MKNTAAALIVLFLTASCYGQSLRRVSTESGSATGVPGRDASITAFKGIPYAEPPVGALRWTAPRPAKHWEGVRNADHFSDGCAQVFPKGDFPKSEDCLYLNVWTPAKSKDASLPVLVWIHGGGLRVGCSCEALYEGEEFARKGIVVVNLNYRLGIFGFFAHPELTRESEHHASGNYGLLDQLAALKWVQRNIRAFGGDPTKVTIAGQSSGAFSVNMHVASPLSNGLFRAAIAESGGVGAGFARSGLPSLQESEQAGVKLAESLGAHSLAELRAIPTDKLLQAAAANQGDIDGWFLPESPVTLFATGKINKVPMILGSNSDEGQHMIRTAVPANEFAEHARGDYGADAEKFLAIYPWDSDESAKASQQRQFADRTAFGERKLATDVVRAGEKVFLYFFTYLDDAGYNAETPTLGLKLGADHGAELPYVFGVVGHWKTKAPEGDLQLERTTMSYWANFIKRLDPNGPSLAAWKPFTLADDSIMVLDQSVGMRIHPRAAQINFLQQHTGR